MTIHFKKGFPAGSYKETLHEYNGIQNASTPEKPTRFYFYIPGDYIGSGQMGDPKHPEQAQCSIQLLNVIKLTSEKFGMELRK